MQYEIEQEYDQVINERDILGTQLIRRNDELALLYEKLRIQDSALRNGEIQYMNRLDDIRVMRVKLRELVRENTLTKVFSLQILMFLIVVILTNVQSLGCRATN